MLPIAQHTAGRQAEASTHTLTLSRFALTSPFEGKGRAQTLSGCAQNVKHSFHSLTPSPSGPIQFLCRQSSSGLLLELLVYLAAEVNEVSEDEASYHC